MTALLFPSFAANALHLQKSTQQLIILLNMPAGLVIPVTVHKIRDHQIYGKNKTILGHDVFQEADITGAAESFVKYSYLVKHVSDIPRIIKEAFYIATTGRKGPIMPT